MDAFVRPGSANETQCNVGDGVKPGDSAMNDFECVIPILNVSNFAASMDYYVNKLGFTKKWDCGRSAVLWLRRARQDRNLSL